MSAENSTSAEPVEPELVAPEPVAPEAVVPEPVTPEPAPEAIVPHTEPMREKDTAGRASRWALVTAVAAAVISSVVSAGSAVYVSTNSADRSDQLARTQVLRADRQKAYSDFSSAMFDYIAQVALIHGVLQAHQSVEAVRPEILELTSRTNTLLARLNLLWMSGSEQMVEIGARYAQTIAGFGRDHLAPFTVRYFTPEAPGAGDAAGWRRDSDALSAAMADLELAFGELNGAFVEQGSEEMR